jgi:hypothetical protein
MTTRSRVIVGEELVQAFLGEAIRGSFGRNLVPQIEKRLDISRPQPLVIGHRKDDGNVAILSTDDDWFTLRIIEDCAESILGLCRGHGFQRISPIGLF